MRRFERRRYERVMRTATTIGVSFALGALVALGLTWRLDSSPGEETRVVAPAVDAGVQHGPVATTGVEAAAPVAPVTEEIEDRELDIPVEGVEDEALYDSFTDERGERKHHAIDIMAARGTPVLAVEDGTIKKLFNSKAGGLMVYAADSTERFILM
jgi:murein DD-endopeptidase MepM/ murein hydrolase activator NlpD